MLADARDPFPVRRRSVALVAGPRVDHQVPRAAGSMAETHEVLYKRANENAVEEEVLVPHVPDDDFTAIIEDGVSRGLVVFD